MHGEGLSAFLCIVESVHQREQAAMELRDAVQFERDGRALKSEAAQDVGGQVAAVDRQSCRAGQNEGSGLSPLLQRHRFCFVAHPPMGFALIYFSLAFQAVEHLCGGWHGACDGRGASDSFQSHI